MKRYFLIGIGNKGKQYDLTRHNIGFMVIDYLNAEYGDNINYQEKFNSHFNQIIYKNTQLFLIKPQTYVNLSGNAIGEIKRFYKAKNEEIIIIVDDVYLPFGKIRIKTNGSSGGHNGLKSVENCLGKNYPRIRAGIDSDDAGIEGEIDFKAPLNKFVLGKFSKKEQKELPIFIKHLAEASLKMIDGFQKDENFNQAMNTYNSKVWLS